MNIETQEILNLQTEKTIFSDSPIPSKIPNKSYMRFKKRSAVNTAKLRNVQEDPTAVVEFGAENVKEGNTKKPNTNNLSFIDSINDNSIASRVFPQPQKIITSQEGNTKSHKCTEIEKLLSLNPGVKLQYKEGVGRYLTAGRDFVAGETVLSDHSDLAVIGDQVLSVYCSCCLRKLEPQGMKVSLKRCSQCKHIYYCSQKCQRLDWKLHKTECTVLQEYEKNNNSKMQNQTVRLFLRALTLLSNQQKEFDGSDKAAASSQQGGKLDYNKVFEIMESHYFDFSPDKKVFFGQTFMFFTKAVGTDINIPKDPQKLLEIFCRISINGFGTLDEEFDPVGFAVYPRAFLMNHSCRPSCASIFDRQKISIKAIRPIKKGEKITHSYINNLSSFASRQKQLAENYYFECKCSLCQAECSSLAKRVEASFIAKCGNFPQCREQVVDFDYNDAFLQFEQAVDKGMGNSTSILEAHDKLKQTKDFNITDGIADQVALQLQNDLHLETSDDKLGSIGTVFRSPSGPASIKQHRKYCDKCMSFPGQTVANTTTEFSKSSKEQAFREITRNYKKSAEQLAANNNTPALKYIQRAIRAADTMFYPSKSLYFHLNSALMQISINLGNYQIGSNAAASLVRASQDLFGTDARFNPRVLLYEVLSLKMSFLYAELADAELMKELYKKSSDLVYRISKFIAPNNIILLGLVSSKNDLQNLVRTHLTQSLKAKKLLR